MCLNLPQYTQLDDDQKKVYTLPMSGRNLISGPPGTGKSVIAIHRAAAMAKKGKLPTILMFNKLLQLWTAKALEEAGKMAALNKSAVEKLQSKTSEAWFKQWFLETFGVTAPTVDVAINPSGRMPTKYNGKCEVCDQATREGQDLAVRYGAGRWLPVHEACLIVLNEKKSESAYKPIDYQGCVQIAEPQMESALKKAAGINVLIDEGQDLPNSAYVLLSEFCESLTVYLDSAQTITEHKSTEEEIIGILGIEEDRRQILKKNYRNGKEVHQLAEKFRPGHMVVGESPQRKCSDKPKLIGFGSRDEESAWIATLAKNFSNLSLGVFVRTKKRRDAIAKALSDKNIMFQIYNPDVRGQSFDPCKKGITLATQNNAKGLEFDIVVVAGLDEWPSEIPDWLYGQFYVLITRSRDRLYLSYVGKSKEDLPKMTTSDRFKPLISGNLIGNEFRQ